MNLTIKILNIFLNVSGLRLFIKWRTDCFKLLQCFEKCGESCWCSWKTACWGPLGAAGCVEWWESFESSFVALSRIASRLTLGSVPTCQSAATLHQSCTTTYLLLLGEALLIARFSLTKQTAELICLHKNARLTISLHTLPAKPVVFYLILWYSAIFLLLWNGSFFRKFTYLILFKASGIPITNESVLLLYTFCFACELVPIFT